MPVARIGHVIVIAAMAASLTAATTETSQQSGPTQLGNANSTAKSVAECSKLQTDMAVTDGEIENVTVKLARVGADMEQRLVLNRRLTELKNKALHLSEQYLKCGPSGGPLGSVTSAGLAGGPEPASGAGTAPAVPAGSTAPAAPATTPRAAGGLTGKAAEDRCAELFAAAQRLRQAAPAKRAQIARVEGEIDRLKPPDNPTATVFLIDPALVDLMATLSDLKREQTNIASQISILEESMEGIAGCSTTTGKVSAPAVPTALAGTKRTGDAPPRSTPPAPPSTPPTPPVATTAAKPSAATLDISGSWTCLTEKTRIQTEQYRLLLTVSVNSTWRGTMTRTAGRVMTGRSAIGDAIPIEVRHESGMSFRMHSSDSYLDNTAALFREGQLYLSLGFGTVSLTPMSTSSPCTR